MVKVEDFIAGHTESGFEYKYFVPTQINDEWRCETMELIPLLEQAACKLGELNSFARLVPNIDLYIQSHVVKEAVISSRIEGTQTRMEEAMMQIDDIIPERRDDWREVQNYIAAMTEAIGNLETLPVSSRLIRSAHKTLLSGVRGKNKLPGEFRTSQNWIGGNSISDAKFIPPAAALVNECMSDFEKFLNNKDIHLSTLLKIAVAHYQFETIHPFLDGNGRIGRLLITLFLVSEGVLDKPLLYMSAYFDKNKSLYYDNLMEVRVKNDLLHWLKYFLVGVAQTASDAVDRLERVIKLKEELTALIMKVMSRKANHALTLLDALFKEPIMNVEGVSKVCNISFPTASALVKDLQKEEILDEITGNNRNRMFAFKPYLEVFFN